MTTFDDAEITVIIETLLENKESPEHISTICTTVLDILQGKDKKSTGHFEQY